MKSKTLKTLAATTCVVALAACTSVDPYTGEEKTSNALIGSGIGLVGGAAVGALVGVATGGIAQAALIGAGVGALSGGAIGYYMDRQERRLRERLAETGVGVIREGDTIRLVMPSDVTFETDQWAVSSNFYPVLDDVALVMNEFDQSVLEIGGHTDTVGASEYNSSLSLARANSVGAYLANRNVMQERLVISGHGERQPMVPTRDGVDEPRNRRVEMRISPLT